jgi:hypothetical protein
MGKTPFHTLQYLTIYFLLPKKSTDTNFLSMKIKLRMEKILQYL